MKWNRIVADAVKNGCSDELLKESMGEMQAMLDYIADIEPELLWDFKGKILDTLYGSSNYEYLLN